MVAKMVISDTNAESGLGKYLESGRVVKKPELKASAKLAIERHDFELDYRDTDDGYKPDVSDYAERMAERHPKKNLQSLKGRIA